MTIFGYSLYKMDKRSKLASDLTSLLVENRIVVDKSWEKIIVKVLNIKKNG